MKNKNITFQNDCSVTNNVFRERASYKCLHLCRIMKQLMVWGSMAWSTLLKAPSAAPAGRGGYWQTPAAAMLVLSLHYFHTKDMLSPCFSQTMTGNRGETCVGQLPDFSFTCDSSRQSRLAVLPFTRRPASTGPNMLPPSGLSRCQPCITQSVGPPSYFCFLSPPSCAVTGQVNLPWLPGAGRVAIVPCNRVEDDVMKMI